MQRKPPSERIVARAAVLILHLFVIAPNGRLLDSVKDGPAPFESVPDDDNCEK